MDFRTYAEKETADFVSRLAKASADAVAATEKRLSDEAKRAADDARHAADEAQKSVDAQRAEALRVAEALKTELQAAVKQKMSVAASLKEAQAQIESVRAELKTATDRGEVASRQLADARKANEKLETAKNELTAAHGKLTQNHAAVEAELKKSRDGLETARAEAAAAAQKVEKIAAEKGSLEEAAELAHSQSQASEAKLAAVTDLFKQSGARVKLLERTQQDYERKIASLETRLHDAPPAAAPAAPSLSPLPVLDDLLSGFQALGSATTIADVLTTLVEQLAAQFPRVALFRVKKSHLQGEHQIGFDLNTDIAKVVIPLGMDSMLARAASSGQVERLSAEELAESNAAPFSGSPMNALALPIMAGGEPLAIVYADDSGARPAESAEAIDLTIRFAEAMQHHAAALLSRLTNELKTLTELQAYAGSLVRELEQMHAADTQSGLGVSELQERLKGNLEYARSIYQSRIALEGADAAGLLDEELASMIEAQKGTPFGRDLAAAAGRPDISTRSAAS
jgi:hypothetical protein